MRSVGITELNLILNVFFQGGKEELISCYEFCFCFAIQISMRISEDKPGVKMITRKMSDRKF